jgi:outer membrane protein assembly factor BamB
MVDLRISIRRHLFIGSLTASFIHCLCPSAAPAGTALLWSFQAAGSMQSIAAVPDIDGDGRPDIAFEGYENGPTGVDHVFAIRGASSGAGQVIWSARPIGGASSGGGNGDDCLRLGPDLNGDAFPDLLLATAWGGRTAYALNGRTGATLWSYDTYSHYGSNYSGWIYSMDSLGQDLTADGVPEIVFASGSYNDRVHCVNGATGTQIWVYDGGDAFRDIHSLPDIDGDGIRDVVVTLGDDAVTPRVVALSGRTGGLIWQRPIGGSSDFLWNLTFISDITGDGIPEIVPAQWGSTLRCLNGRTGVIVWSVAVNAQQRVVSLDDVNGDGVRDIAIGFDTTSACQVRSGANGALIWTASTSDWTWAIDRIPDCTGDGKNDVVVGDFDGYVYLLDGVTGSIVWSWRNPTGDKIMTIRGVPDLNATGTPDIVAGTQLLYGGTGGKVYALEGNTALASVPPPAGIAGLRLGEAYPNPSGGQVRWSLPAAGGGPIRLDIFGADGRWLRSLGESEGITEGSRTVTWDGRDTRSRLAPAGTYLVKMTAGGGVVVGEGRVVLVR